MEINEELLSLNIDILAKAGIKKSTVNKLHKLKAKKLGDIADISECELGQLLVEDGGLNIEQLNIMLKSDVFEFMRHVFVCIKEDPTYEFAVLHVNNHTHQEIAQNYGTSKERIKQNIVKFLQGLFTLVDIVGSKLIANKPYLAIEELEEIMASEEDYKLLLLAFKAHDTKWVYHNEAECFTRK